MWLILLSLSYLFVSGLISLLIFSGNKKRGNIIGMSGPVIAIVVSSISILRALIGHCDSIVFNWALPFASFHANLDSLSAFFMIPVLVLSAAGAFYGMGYMRKHFEKGEKLSFWFWYNLLEGGMILVLISQNFIMFLIAWEIMTVASFFLVCTEHQNEEYRKAAWIYLTAAHIGTFFIMAVFAVLGFHSGIYSFVTIYNFSGMAMVFIFIASLIGFGLKAGFVPLHVWLPEAHPAAPSNVSAVMSGAMINIGLFGILKVIIAINGFNSRIGWTLLIIGLISCFFGIISGMVQQNIKRLLAYSSVENMGIITIGIGLGILGISYNNIFIAVLALIGAMLHILNHSLFKGLLFMCAGNILHETGTIDIEKLGGLLKKMPVTGLSFLIGGVSICGIPPFNGFIGEFMIYAAAVSLIFPLSLSSTIAGLITIITLALSGGIAVIAFTKAFGIAFLGEPRSDKIHEVTEVAGYMKYPPLYLAFGCIGTVVLSPLLLKLLSGVAGTIIGNTQGFTSVFNEILHILYGVILVYIIVVIISFLLWKLKSGIMKKQPVEKGPTWDCGYSKPHVRMQYTGDSYVQPMYDFFSFITNPIFHKRVPGWKLFPGKAFFRSVFPDFFIRFVFEKLFGFVLKLFEKLRWLQSGNVQLYILYIAITLVVLIAWELI